MSKSSFLTTILLLLFLRPASHAAIVVMNGLTHTHSVTEGSTTQGKIIVHNQGNFAKRIVIYKNDLQTNCDGTYIYSEPGEHPRSLNPFLQTSVEERLLQPNEEYTIFYNINISGSSVTNGTYWGLIMVEGVDPVKAEENENVQVNSKVRYAIQIIADLGGFVGPELVYNEVSFQDQDIPEGGKQKTLNVFLKNTGVYASKVKLILELYDNEGNVITTLEGQQRRIYPANCSSFSIPLKGLDAKAYTGVLVADNGEDLFGANVSFQID